MLNTYRKLFDLLTPAEHRRVYLLLGMILVMGVVETMGIASILPFMAVLANPGVIESNEHLARLYAALGFTSSRNFLIFLGVGVFCVLVFGLIFRAATQYAIYRFSSMRAYSVSSRMLRGYLYQPYTWFLNRHSADLGAKILTEVSNAVSGAMIPAIRLVTQTFVVCLLVTLLFLVQPVVALVAAVTLGACYSLIYLGVRRYLGRIGEARYQANQQRFQVAGEAIGGIKDVKLLGLENGYVRRFQGPARRWAEAVAASNVVKEIPRFALEAIAFGGMLLMILTLLVTGDGSLGEVLPVLSVYAFAGLRLFPALQGIYASVTTLRFAQPSIERLHSDMLANQANERRRPAPHSGAALGLRQRIELRDIHYSYPNASRPALAGVDMAIEANTTVGIVGGTGAGKTTTIDLILGLLMAQRGELRVDGTPVTPGNVRAWQASIGYVPQQIFLTDDSVSANVAFGLEPDQIDPAAVERAARIAELHDFVMTEMPNGYASLVGERGVRLSGGQRQRIGIARAIYHDPDVLILDEATSALDNLTEKAVMDAVHNLGHAKTIIIIAHRLSTVRECDTIFMMEHGRVIARGSYEQLLSESEKFRAMALVGAAAS